MIAWSVYLVVVLVLFVRANRRPAAKHAPAGSTSPTLIPVTSPGRIRCRYLKGIHGDSTHCQTRRVHLARGGHPLILAGCTDKADEDAIKVTSTKTECDLDSTEAQTGDVDFSVTNNGTKVTEFYVYGTATGFSARSRTSAPASPAI